MWLISYKGSRTFPNRISSIFLIEGKLHGTDYLTRVHSVAQCLPTIKTKWNMKYQMLHGSVSKRSNLRMWSRPLSFSSTVHCLLFWLRVAPIHWRVSVCELYPVTKIILESETKEWIDGKVVVGKEFYQWHLSEFEFLVRALYFAFWFLSCCKVITLQGSPL